MAKCKNCKVDKKHRNSTYFQTVKKDGTRELPKEAGRSAHSWTVMDAFYYCHDCIRNHWYVRKQIDRELSRANVDHKILREIPEMVDLTREKAVH